MTKPMKSPLRYPGGKSRALNSIMPLIPGDVLEFREPFIGGGSVFLAHKSGYGLFTSQYWINDLNFDLYCFWKAAKESLAELVESVRTYRKQYKDGRELYTFLNDEDNIQTEFEHAVRFFIMNRITFSGVTDAGGYSQQAFEKRFTASSVDRIENLKHIMRDVQITHGDYQEVVCASGEQVFLFLDPPYYSATKSRLYGNNGELHTSFDHERFAEVMSQCPHRWLITYDDSPEIRDLFGFAEIISWELQYGMNNYKQGKAAKGNEVFIKNY